MPPDAFPVSVIVPPLQLIVLALVLADSGGGAVIFTVHGIVFALPTASLTVIVTVMVVPGGTSVPATGF